MGPPKSCVTAARDGHAWWGEYANLPQCIEERPSEVNASRIIPTIIRPAMLSLQDLEDLVDNVRQQYMEEPAAEAAESSMLLTDLVMATTEAEATVARAVKELAAAHKRVDDLTIMQIRHDAMRSEMTEFIHAHEVETTAEERGHTEQLTNFDNILASLSDDLDACQDLTRSVAGFVAGEGNWTTADLQAFVFRVEHIAHRVSYGAASSINGNEPGAVDEVMAVLQNLVQHIESTMRVETAHREQLITDHVAAVAYRAGQRDERAKLLREAEDDYEETTHNLHEERIVETRAEVELNDATSALQRFHDEQDSMENIHALRSGHIHKTLMLLGDVKDKVEVLQMYQGLGG